MQTLVEAKNLRKIYRIRKGIWKICDEIHAVDCVNLHIKKGETFGLVGESGCGKSTLAKLLLRLEEPDEGTIIFDGIDITSLTDLELKPFRKKIQIIFQDPYDSLNPRKTIFQILEEPLKIHGLFNDKKLRKEKIKEVLEKVKLSLDTLDKYPHEFSGGQRQRIAIARAIILDPELIIADEPLSALDVSVQAQILNLFMELKEQMSLTYFFISHDIGIVEYVADRIAVMYAGRIVEVGLTKEIIDCPLHPYTQELLASVLKIGLKKRMCFSSFKEEMLNYKRSRQGCVFFNRCPQRIARCEYETPSLEEIAKEHFVACFRVFT